MKKYIEKREIFADDIRRLCIKNNWYTCGSVQDYEKMLSMCDNENMETDDIVRLARDIMEHSNDKDRDLENYCFEVANVSFTTFEKRKC